MIQTIHLINVTKKKKKILVTANIEFDTLQTEEDVQNAFEEVLPKALKVTQKKPNQTAANFLQTAMAMVNERYKDSSQEKYTRIRLQTGHYLLFQSFRRPQMITSKN